MWIDTLETCVWIGASPVARKLRSRMVASISRPGQQLALPSCTLHGALSVCHTDSFSHCPAGQGSGARSRGNERPIRRSAAPPPPKRRAGVAARRCCPSQAVARDPGPARAPLTKAHQNQSRNASHKRRGGQEAEALPSCTTAIRASAGTAIRPADGCNRRPQYVPAALLGA